MRSSKRPVHALHRYRCRWAWVSSKPSRTTASLPHAGQWTPSGQRCWRTRAKHLASSISAKRLTRSGTAILEGPHTRWPARAVLADYHRAPAGTLPRPLPITPEPNKSLRCFPRFAQAFAGMAFTRHTAWLSDDGAGAALWLPPDAHPDEDALVAL